MFRELLVKLLFKLLELPSYRGISDKNIAQFLASLHQDQRFRDYYRKRDLAILRTLGMGLSERDSWIMVGQRLELNMMLNNIDRAFKVEERRKNKLITKK